MKTFTNSDEETQNLGEEFSHQLKPRDVVFLIGELGSGKTTFVKGLAKGLGIESRIISPTFVVARKHSVKPTHYNLQPGQINTLYHLDLYRLENEKQALGVDLKDFLDDPEGLTVIEWPEVSQNIVEGKVWKVKFKHTENEGREITIDFE